LEGGDTISPLKCDSKHRCKYSHDYLHVVFLIEEMVARKDTTTNEMMTVSENLKLLPKPTLLSPNLLEKRYENR
jgi:hypothetical protein